jgi:hypothetical protein
VTKGDLHAEENPDRPEDGRPQPGDGGEVDAESQWEHKESDHGEGKDDAEDVAHSTFDA